MKRDYLVFSRVGAKSLHHGWLEGDSERLWDLQLSQYDDDPDIAQNGDLPLSVDKGRKWDSIQRYFHENPQVLTDYKYILFIDDDVKTNADDLNKLFQVCEEEELVIAQPSLHPDSYIAHAILMNMPFSKLRYSNFIESMVSVIRTDYLRQHVTKYMDGLKYGWGIDFVWCLWMEDPVFRAAVIDDVCVLHTRPQGTGNKGSLYAGLDPNADTPENEMARFISRFDNLPGKVINYGYLSHKGHVRNGVISRFLNGSHLAFASLSCRNKRRMLRGGIAMLVRALTWIGYRPVKAVEKGPRNVAHQSGQELTQSDLA